MTVIVAAYWFLLVQFLASFICGTGFIGACIIWVSIIEGASYINFFIVVLNLFSACLSVFTDIGITSLSSKCSARFTVFTRSILFTRISWVGISEWAGVIESLGFRFITVIGTALNSSYITIRITRVCLFGSLLILDALISSSIRSTVSI